MITFKKGKDFSVEWKIVRGQNMSSEDFSGALVNVYLIGPDNIYPVKPFVVNNDGYQILRIDVCSENLAAGVYDVKVVWLKNRSLPGYTGYCDSRANVSVKSGVFAITDIHSEVTYDGDIVRIMSKVDSYGKDGMSAYEIAVMRGLTSLSEADWLKGIQGDLTIVEELLDKKADKTTVEELLDKKADKTIVDNILKEIISIRDAIDTLARDVEDLKDSGGQNAPSYPDRPGGGDGDEDGGDTDGGVFSIKLQPSNISCDANGKASQLVSMYVYNGGNVSPSIHIKDGWIKQSGGWQSSAGNPSIHQCLLSIEENTGSARSSEVAFGAINENGEVKTATLSISQLAAIDEEDKPNGGVFSIELHPSSCTFNSDYAEKDITVLVYNGVKVSLDLDIKSDWIQRVGSGWSSTDGNPSRHTCTISVKQNTGGLRNGEVVFTAEDANGNSKSATLSVEQLASSDTQYMYIGYMDEDILRTYGVLDNGVSEILNSINKGAVDAAVNKGILSKEVLSAKGKTAFKNAPEDTITMILIPASSSLKAVLDDGFGGQTEFNHPQLHANGEVIVDLGGIPYKVYGEYQSIPIMSGSLNYYIN